MFPISTVQAGTTQGTANVCNTPTPGGPVPILYPSIGFVPQAKAATCARKTTVMNNAVCLKGTKIPMTTGDEPGTNGGIISGKNRGEAVFKAGSGTVTIEGKPAAHLNAQVASNGSNANAPVGFQVVPSQAKVLIPA